MSQGPIPNVPEQDPNQSELWLPRVANPYLSVWWTQQTVSDVPENVMGWLVAQGFEITGVRLDQTTVPPTYYFNLKRQGITPQQVLLSLCNSYTIAANDARTANQVRYNQILSNWTQLIDTSHDQFDAQTAVQNSQAGVYLADLDQYMDEINTLIDENRSQIILDAAEAKAALGQMDTRLVDLEANAEASADKIEDLLANHLANLSQFVNDYRQRLIEIDQNFAEQLSKVLAQIASLDVVMESHIADYNAQFAVLANNYNAHKAEIDNALTRIDANVTTYVTEVADILTRLDSDFSEVETDLESIKNSAGDLVDSHAGRYQGILDRLTADFETHAAIARGFLVDLGSEELARINEEAAASLAAQIQRLVSQGLFMSKIVSDVTARNHRDRDERVQALNDRLMREKLENQHRLYEQEVATRARTLDGSNQLHGVQQEVLRYQASLVSNIYGLQQEVRNRVLNGKQAIFAAKDANEKIAMEMRSNLYGKLQEVRQRTIESADRVYQLRDIFAKWENTETNRLYEQVQQVEGILLSGVDKEYASNQDVVRVEIGQRDSLLQQIQDALKSLLSGKERYSSLLMQNASTLAEHKHRAIVERMNVAVKRLDGWQTIADQNRQLMAYQLDERNKLLIGLYSFVERREDIAPEWKDMSQMIAGLADSGGGWLTPN